MWKVLDHKQLFLFYKCSETHLSKVDSQFVNTITEQSTVASSTTYLSTGESEIFEGLIDQLFGLAGSECPSDAVSINQSIIFNQSW